MMPRGFFRRSGFTLVELLLSLAVFGIAMSGVLAISTWAMDSIQTESSKATRNIENIEMLKLLTQPFYFGAQGNYSGNDILKQCMEVDTIDCDTDKSYSIVPYDLNTDQPLEMASTGDAAAIQNSITFQVHCPNNELHCDKAEYFTVNVKTSLNYHGIQFGALEKSGVVTPEFSNVVTFVPDAVTAPGRPINVLLYLDNSNSMVFAKAQIQAALGDLVDKISTMDVTLGVWGLGSSYASKSELFTLDAFNVRQPMPPSPYPDSLVYYEETTTSAYHSLDYNNQALATFANPSTAARVFKFLSTDNAGARATKKAAVQALVDGLFNNPSTSLDRPLCNIIRMLEAPDALSSFKLDPFTPTVIFIISNEDDETNFVGGSVNNCEKGEITKWEPRRNNGRYTATAQMSYADLDITANVTLDGAPAPPKNVSGSTRVNVPVPYKSGASCMDIIGTITTSTIENLIQGYLSAQRAAQVYTPGAGYTITNCSYTSFGYTLASGSNVTDNYCDTVTANSLPINYRSSYIPNSCSISGYAAYNYHYEVPYQYKLFYPTGTLPEDAVYQTLKSKLGLDNLFYLPIIHPDSATCALTAGSQVGTRYKALALKPGLKSSVVPICSPTFTGGLDDLQQWTQTLGASDITLPASVAANFSDVEIVRGSTVIALTKETDYTVSGLSLIFKNSILQPNDIVKVYLK